MSSSKHHIDALDGLRGLAILMVIFTHLHIGLLYTYTPVWLQPIVRIINNSGGIGVLLFFMLSGYLMATVYPTVPNVLDFWQKRYTRIFPPFVVMCVALAIIKRNWDQLTLTSMIAILIGMMVAGGLLWRGIQHLRHRERIGKIIFFGFFIIQIITAISYMVLQMRVPGAVYYIVWPETVRTAINTLVNLTMTIPFGRYVGQLDGVYWSVIAEVSFYLLYPFIILPGIQIVRHTNWRIVTFLSVALLFPLCYGLNLLFQQIYFFSMIQIQLILYFLAGAIIGSSSDSPIMKRIGALLLRLPQVPLLCVAGASIFIGLYIPVHQTLQNFLIIFPLSLGFIITLSPQTMWTRFISTPFFRWLGKISFSLYLTHTIAIDIVSRYGEPTTFSGMVRHNLYVVGLLGVLAYILHIAMERPYFHHAKGLGVPENKQLQRFMHVSSRRFILAACVVIALVWFGYRVPTSFATLVVNITNKNLPRLVTIPPATLAIPFEATYDNLGMLIFAIKPLKKDESLQLGYVPGNYVNANLIAEITDQTGRIIHTVAYPLIQIYESKFFTVGLPVETQSRGNSYQLHLSIDQATTNTYLALVNTNVTLRQIYMVKKEDLLKQPPLMVGVLWNKFSLPFTEPEPWIVLISCLPVFITLAIASYKYQPREQYLRN